MPPRPLAHVDGYRQFHHIGRILDRRAGFFLVSGRGGLELHMVTQLGVILQDIRIGKSGN